MAEGLPDLVSHVRLDTTDVAAGVAKTKAELGGLGSATGSLEKGFKGLLSSITGLGPGTSALSGHFTNFAGAAGKAKDNMAAVASEGSGLKSVLTGVGVGVAGLGVAFAGFALAAVGKFLSVASEVNKLKTTLGSTAEDASRVRNVAIGLGVDVDTMGKAFFKLGPILEQNKGDLAGVHVEIAKNADGSTNLIETIGNMRAAYQSLNDPIQKAQFLQEAFKKTGLDLRPIMAATAEQFNKLANTGPIIHQADIDKAKELAIAQRELKQKIDEVEISFVQKAIPAYEKADHAAYQLFKTFELGVQRLTGLGDTSKTVDQISHAFDEGKGSAAAYAEKQREVAEAVAETAKALDKLSTAQERNLDATISLEKGHLAVAKATDAVEKAHSEAAAAVAKYGATSDEATAASEKEEDAQDRLKEAVVALAKETRDKAVAEAEAAGVTVSAQMKVDLLKQALLQQADVIGGPLGEQLRNYASLIHEIPDEKPTYIRLPGADGVLNTLDDIYERIEGIPTRKDVYVVVHNSDTGREEGTDRTGNQVATGGVLGPRSIVPLAAGGRTSGFVTNRPTFLVGEGDPKWPEIVIATDPKYRARNLNLAALANRALGVPPPYASAPSLRSTGGGLGAVPSGASPATAASAPPPMVHTTIVLDRKVLATAVAQGTLENRRAHR